MNSLRTTTAWNFTLKIWKKSKEWAVFSFLRLLKLEKIEMIKENGPKKKEPLQKKEKNILKWIRRYEHMNKINVAKTE